MEQQSIRKTYKYKLKPTPEQERMLDRTLMLCRHVYNAAIEERREAWRKRGVSVSYYQQKAELARHQGSHAGVRRSPQPGLAGCGVAGRSRLPGVLPPREGGRDTGLSALSRTRPLQQFHLSAVRQRARRTGQWLPGPVQDRAHRRPLVPPMEGTPKTVTISREADGWYVCFSCADVPVQPLARDWTGDRHRPGHGSVRHPLRWHAHPLARLVSQGRTGAQNRAAPSESRARRAATAGARR